MGVIIERVLGRTIFTTIRDGVVPGESSESGTADGGTCGEGGSESSHGNSFHFLLMGR